MVAIEITPTLLCKRNLPIVSEVGTPIRVVDYLFKATKITQADWIVFDTYLSGKFITGRGSTGTGDKIPELINYEVTGTKVVLNGTGTGETYFWVTVEE